MALFRNFSVSHAQGGQVTPKADKSRPRRTSHAEGGQVGGIACAAYRSMPPRNSLISLNLRKIEHFWIGNLSVSFMEPRMDTNLGLQVPSFEFQFSSFYLRKELTV
jgi:hypothetical protein